MIGGGERGIVVQNTVKHKIVQVRLQCFKSTKLKDSW